MNIRIRWNRDNAEKCTSESLEVKTELPDAIPVEQVEAHVKTLLELSASEFWKDRGEDDDKEPWQKQA